MERRSAQPVQPAGMVLRIGCCRFVATVVMGDKSLKGDDHGGEPGATRCCCFSVKAPSQALALINDMTYSPAGQVTPIHGGYGRSAHGTTVRPGEGVRVCGIPRQHPGV